MMCQTCAACASGKSPMCSSRSPMGTITASYPTQIMAVDIVGPFPESDQGNSYIMVVGDYFSRWMEAIPILNQEAATVADRSVPTILGTRATALLVQEVCKLGLLHTIHKVTGSLSYLIERC